MIQAIYQPTPDLAKEKELQPLRVDQVRNLQVTQPALAVRTVTVGSITYIG